MNTTDLVHGCFPCDQQAVPPFHREDVVHTNHWRVAHAFNSTLPGWLVLLPTRHVTAPTSRTGGSSRNGPGSRWTVTTFSRPAGLLAERHPVTAYRLLQRLL